MNIILYVSTVLIWGSTWLAITFQLGEVDPLLSVAYRFALASLVLLIYCLIVGKRLRFSLRAHTFIFLQGTCLFGLNYWLIYLATEHLTSGLIAVVFATIVLMNAFNGRLFLKNPVQPHTVLAALIGLAGIALVFRPEFEGLGLKKGAGLALLMAAGGTYLASLGNILSLRNQLDGLPVLQTNAYGMGYGALLMLAVALTRGQSIAFDWSFPYVCSMLYLSVFGSIVAFGCYLTLVGRLGAEKAAYASLLFPIVALQLSVWFEGYQWTTHSLVGVSMVLFGNLIIITPVKILRRLIDRLTSRIEQTP